MSLPPQPRLSLQALLDLSGLNTATVEAPNGNRGVHEVLAPQTVLAEKLGVTRRSVCRWAHDGIPLTWAEDAAHLLGVHPCEVWGDDWIAAALGEDIAS